MQGEAKTLQILEENKLYESCDQGHCSRPHSLILLLRDKLKDYDSSCDELRQLYSEEIKNEFTNEVLVCTKEYKEQFDSNHLKPGTMLAIGSIIITVVAMLLHSKSAFLTLFGLLQILFSIPMAYFFYTAIVGISFFHTLNTISIFVAAALGADDFFVAVDKFKNARIDNPAGSTEDIAQSAFPSAGLAITCTTMAAFFSTCICPVTRIFCFAVFCGLSVTFNYILVILLIFPALCLYDSWLQGGNKNALLSFGGRDRGRTPPSTVEETENPQEHDIENNAQNSKKTRQI